MNRNLAVALMAIVMQFAAPATARAADIDAHTKYLAFIEAFQYFFEYCQAETQLPEAQVRYARDHIGERRALIFTGLNEGERKKIAEEAGAKKWEMVEYVLSYVRKNKLDMPLGDMCRQGFFEGIMDSERRDEEKEVDAIRKAKL